MLTQSCDPTPSASNTLYALSKLLEAARHRARVTALALADAQGLLIAGAGRFATCEELSADAALPRRATLAGEIQLGTERVLLCASGPLEDRELVSEVVAACQRILAPSRRQLV